MGYHVSATEGPSKPKNVVLPDEEIRVCRRWSTTLCRRRPIQNEKRGASGRRNKALRAVGHHVSAGESPSDPKDVVLPDEETR